MRSWLGAVAVAAVVLVSPSVAAAGPDDPAQVQFKLRARCRDRGVPSARAQHGSRDLRTADGGTLVSAWVTDDQLAAARARGFEPVATIADKDAIDRIRAERNATIAAKQAAERALSVNAAGRQGRSAAPGAVSAQRADYYENNVGRFLSIEASHVDGLANCRGGASPQCPVVVAEYYDAAGNRLGGGNLGVYYDDRLNPDYYQYHFFVFRVGDKGDGAVLPAKIKVAAPNGDVDTLDVREWIAQDPPPPGPGFLSGFVTHYNDSQEAYKKMRDLAAEFPNIAQAYELPEKTLGYQRKAQTMLGYNATAPYVTFDANNLPVAGAAPSDGEPAAHGRADLEGLRPSRRQQPVGAARRPRRARTRR